MRIIKHFIERDERSDFVSRIFDVALAGFEYPWVYETMELFVRDENFATSGDESATVVIDYNHPFVADFDEKGVRALVIAAFFRLLAQRMYGSLPKPIETVLAYRQMAKRYGDLLEYMAYNDLLSRRISGVEDFIAASSYWLAFAGIDKCNEEMLRGVTPHAGKEYVLATNKLFAVLKSDLTKKESMAMALRAYGEIACR